ncbi:MFS family permease [Catenuloplanes nepalensis]|uniref:MFS family permease n=1 Tax=Catenuloplanes nepalensis TaxID=587533 RepID=A0ABT9MQ96_9ACTN|nr:MFS transporter [Catenuloplanes nepalensis]MDP9793251.1 MFS family permease [Catenuloplanes nepalensis]
MATREIRDLYGRHYRVGETDRQLLGRPRAVLLATACAAMAAVGLLQYGFAAALPVLDPTFPHTEPLAALAVWVACQAVSAPLAAVLYRRLRGSPAVPLLAAAVLSGTALLTIAYAHTLPALVLGYGVLGGLGAGLTYLTCIAVVTEWYPERTAARAGLVSGAFALGSAPVAVLAGTGFFTVAAIVVAAVLAGSAIVLRKPPRHWWPPAIDPQRWAVDRALNPSIPHNIPAVRRWSAATAARSAALPAICVVVVLTSTLALFDLAYLGGYGQAPAIAALAAAAGLGRASTGTLSDRLGRRRTLGVALALGGVAQFGLLTAVHARSTAGAVLFGALAGAGVGTGYSLLVALVRDFFGGDALIPIYGIAYAGKAIGGVAGVVLAAVLLGAAPSATLITAVAGLAGLCTAALTLTLHQPGRPRTLPTAS